MAHRKLLQQNPTPAQVMLPKHHDPGALHNLQADLQVRLSPGSSAHLVWGFSEVVTAYVTLGRGQPCASALFQRLPDIVLVTLPLELAES